MKLTANIGELRMRETPGPESKVIEVYPEGTSFKDLGEVSDFTTRIQLRGIQFDEPWLKVEAPDGKQGWIYGGALNFDLNEGNGHLSTQLIDKRLQTLFGKDQKDRINLYRQHFQEATQAKDVAAVYREGIAIIEAINKVLEGKFNHLDLEKMPDLFWLQQCVPGFIPQLVAEGTEYMLFEDYRQWLPLAKATDSKVDDQYFELCASAYREDSIHYFFPAWTIQTWDYGGHSLLGEGIHLEILTAANQNLQNDTLFKPELINIKSKVVKDITENYTTFWEPQEAILSEMDSLLARNLQILTKNDKVALNVRRQQFTEPLKHQIQVNHRAGIYD
ncbi:MAG: hypothetical protein DHS20C18_08550 [Saprospiraceae bacterium]|nr:MAG: hypothetical protein DHS20C18_08550 [Saprospiraceae bacterium]